MSGRRPFDPNELDSAAPSELDDALTTAAWLEGSMLDVPVHPSPDFSDRVMAALAAEPTPAPAGFLSPVRRRGFASGFVSSVRQAWASAFTGGRPPLVRASALAYVLAVVMVGTALAGAATISVGSALGIIGPSATQTPAQVTPTPTDLTEPSGLEPPESGDPDASEEPGDSESPDASDDHDGSSGPDATDDHDGDSSGPGSSDGGDDHSGPSSTESGSDDHETATPRPSGTPKPTSTSDSGGDG